MATSQSLSESARIKGQTALMCGLCENDPKLKWKCLDCKLMMCKRCREKVHPKFASAEDHTIIDIKDIGQPQTDYEPKPELTKLKCEVHSGRNCCFYCATCEILVCQTCVTKTHNTHKFKEITEEYEIKLEKLQDEQRDIRNKVQILTHNEQKLKQIKSSEQSNYETVKQEILDDDKVLKNEIKKHTDKLLKDLDQKWEAVLNYINGETKRMQRKLKEIQEQQQEVNKLLQVNNAKDVFSVPGSPLKSEKENVQPLNISFPGVPPFIHGDKTKITQILGKLDDVTIQVNSNLQVKEQYETELGCISSIVLCPDGDLWISDRGSKIQKVKLRNRNKLSVILNMDIKIYDIALLPTGDLLLSVSESPNLKLISSGSTSIKDSVVTVSPLIPKAVHITKNKTIIVGARGAGPAFPAIKPRKVIVMDLNGCQEIVLQNDIYNNPLFTLPCVITSNSQGNIAVVDVVYDDYRGRVVVLGKGGEVRNIYTGHPDVNNKDNPFRPKGITTTPLDNFVVTDMDNHTLHILNTEGEIITFYNTEEMVILIPYSLSFSTTGQLYIGCSTYTDSGDKAKLFVINNFLF